MKKIIIIFSIFALVFTSVYVVPSKHVDAAILSKVASAGAKKVVKEVIKDAAIETAMQFAVSEAFKMVEAEKSKYKLQAEYELFCGKKMPDLVTCERPMQIKKDLTDFDKVAIGNQAELELEKLINGGTGFTKWQKFLDWFLPIWVLSFTVTALTYALDPDVRSLFNEAGYNALVALGIIKPVEQYTNVIPPIQDVRLPDTSDSQNVDSVNVYTSAISAIGTWYNIPLTMDWKPNRNYYFKSDLTNPNNDVTFMRHDVIQTENMNTIWQIDTRTNVLLTGRVHFGGTVRTPAISVNGGTPIIPQAIAGNGIYSTYTIPTEINDLLKKSNQIVTRSPLLVDGFYYTDIVFRTTTSDVITLQVKSDFIEMAHDYGYTSGGIEFGSSAQRTVRYSAFMNQVMTPPKILELPVYDSEEVSTNYGNSNYENEEQKVTMVPPSALPYTKTSTGEPLEPKRVGDDIIFITPDGTEVPEDDITIGDPNIQDTPDGKVVTSPPTQSNPEPQPIPLQPPPPNTPPTGTGVPPPPEDGGGGKPNIPLSLLLGLFKLLNAIIFYLIRMAAFIISIQFIEPTIIPNPYFQWFTTAEILGIKPYPLVKNVALFFLSFSIYKSIRRVFP